MFFARETPNFLKFQKTRQLSRANILRMLHAKNQPLRSKTVAYRPRTDGQTEKVKTEDPFFSNFFFIFDFLLKEPSDMFFKCFTDFDIFSFFLYFSVCLRFPTMLFLWQNAQKPPFNAQYGH